MPIWQPGRDLRPCPQAPRPARESIITAAESLIHHGIVPQPRDRR
ncbi:MAG TPA: hypothetical protein VFV73_05130 [Streptosporangiaceae bacterium]|nr:hypothetical protein [Streptosporangiaceae bacterium]